MRKLARCICALLVTSFAHAASAEEGEDEDETSEFVRTGFYLGVGGTAAFPANWDDDYNNDLNDDFTDLANAAAQDNAPGSALIPLEVTVDGADLEDALFGANGVIGYRLGEVVAFEVEGEWLISKNKSNLDVSANSTLVQESTGKHKVEVKDVWNVTGNVKAYAPFEVFTGRFQPFVKVGAGVQNSKVVTTVSTSDLSTIFNFDPPTKGPEVVPADFQFRESKSSLDGVLRFGGGIDIYATRNIVVELNTTYVVPFAKMGSMRADYVSVQWRLVYRF
jgi:hypothetical protein